jgi:hypothetical protein
MLPWWLGAESCILWTWHGYRNDWERTAGLAPKTGCDADLHAARVSLAASLSTLSGCSRPKTFVASRMVPVWFALA